MQECIDLAKQLVEALESEGADKDLIELAEGLADAIEESYDEDDKSPDDMNEDELKKMPLNKLEDHMMSKGGYEKGPHSKLLIKIHLPEVNPEEK